MHEAAGQLRATCAGFKDILNADVNALMCVVNR